MDYEGFKTKILKKSGIDLSSYKERQMKRRIDTFMSRYNCADYQTFYTLLEKDQSVYTEFINFITINVSEFYRNPSQWFVLEKEIIPMILKNKKTKLNVWSAACSTGEEPYSLVMLLSKFFNFKDIKVLATDIDKEALLKAKNGVYHERSLKNLPEEFLSKYFSKLDGLYKISDTIKECVEFRSHDLLKDEYPNNMDLVVCRNVLIYFTEDVKDKIFRKFHNSLNYGGVLFLGSTEQIIFPQKYGLKTIKSFFYMKVE